MERGFHVQSGIYTSYSDDLCTEGAGLLLCKDKRLTCFPEYEHEKKKTQVYRFWLEAAGDGEVAPFILPGNYRLGTERTKISEGAQEGEGFFFDIYRERKLLEMLFDTVALKYDLMTSDVKVLYYLSQPHENCTFKEMAAIAENVLREILIVLTDFEQIQYESFSQEEIELYEKLNEKRSQNMQKALRQIG